MEGTDERKSASDPAAPDTPAAVEAQGAASPGQAGGEERKPGSLMSDLGGQGEKQADKQAEEQAEQEQEEKDPSLAVPEKPEGYAFTLPDGMEADKDLAAQFSEAAHANGLSQKQAQDLATMYAGYAQEKAAKEEQQRIDAFVAWEKAEREKIEARPDFGAQKADVTRFLTAFGSPALYEVLDQTLLGSHPALFDLFSKAGAALGEPGLKRSDAGKEDDFINTHYPASSKDW